MCLNLQWSRHCSPPQRDLQGASYRQLRLHKIFLSVTALLQEEQRTEEDLADLAASAQLHHQLRILGAALQTAQLDPAQFGLNATVSSCKSAHLRSRKRRALQLACSKHEPVRPHGWMGIPRLSGIVIMKACLAHVCGVHCESVTTSGEATDHLAQDSTVTVMERMVCMHRDTQWWNSLRPFRGRLMRSERTEYRE